MTSSISISCSESDLEMSRSPSPQSCGENLMQEPEKYTMAYAMISLKHRGHVNYDISRSEYKNMSLISRLEHATLTLEPDLYVTSLSTTNDVNCESDVHRIQRINTMTGIEMINQEGALDDIRKELDRFGLKVLHTNFTDALVLRTLQKKYNKTEFVVSPHVGVSITPPKRDLPALDEMYDQLKKVMAIYGNEQDSYRVVDFLSRQLVDIRKRAGTVEGEPHVLHEAYQTIADTKDVVHRVDGIIDKVSAFFTDKLPSLALNVLAFIIDFFSLLSEFSYTRASSLFLRFIAMCSGSHLESVIRPYWEQLIAFILPAKLTTVDTNNSGKSRQVAGEMHMLHTMKQVFAKDMPTAVHHATRAIGIVAVTAATTYDENDGLSWSMLAKALVALCGYLLGVTVINTITINGIVNGLKIITSLGSAIRSIPTIIEAIIKMVPECLMGWASYIAPGYTWSMSPDGQAYQQWIKDVQEMTTDSRIILIMRSTHDQLKVEELALQAHAYFAKFSDAEKLNSVVAGSFRECFGKITRLANQVAEARGIGPRTEPFHVSIYGHPGIGKSHFASAVASVLAPSTDLMGNPIPENMRVYSYTPGSTFMDGYMQQPVMVMDDVNQLTSGEDAIEMIRFIGTTPLVANMATLDNPAIGVKGTRFTSTIVVSTTNILYPIPKNIISAQALNRRRHVLLEAKRVSKFFDGQKLLVDTMTPEELMEFKYIEVRQRDPICDTEPPGPWMSALDMLINLKDLNEQHQRRENVFKDRGFSKLADAMKKKLAEVTVHATAEQIVPCVVGNPHMFSYVRKRFKQQEDQEECPMVDVLNEMGFSTAQATLEGKVSSMSPQEFVHIHCQSHELYGMSDEQEIELWNACSGKHQLPKMVVLTPMQRFQRLVDEAKTQLVGYPILEWAIMSIGVIGAVGMLIWSFMRMKGDDEDYDPSQVVMSINGNKTVSFPSQEHMANPSSGETATRANKTGRYKAGYTALGKPHAASSVEIKQQVVDPMIALFRKNVVRLENSRGSVVHATSTGKNLIFTVAHFFEGMVDGDTLIVYRLGKPIVTNYESMRKRIFNMGDSKRDLAVYALPYDVVPLFRDITSHIADPNAIDTLTSTNGMIVGVDIEYALPRIQPTTRVYTHMNGLFTVDNGFEYPGHRGVVGQCGLPLIANFSSQWNENSISKFIGIHTGCYGIAGYAETVTKCEYDDAVLSLGKLVAPFQAHVVASEMHCKEGNCQNSRWLHEDVESKQIWPVGTIATAVRLPAKHRFTPSPIFGHVAEAVTDNSVLSPFDERLLPEEKGKSPLLKAHAKVANGKECFPRDVIDDFVANKIQFFKNVAPERTVRVLSWDEAINGIIGDPYIEKLNMSTSAGYGYSAANSRGKKHLFVEDTPNHFVPTPAFQAKLDILWEALRTGEPIAHVWKATLKTERRKFEKIRLGKTRQFNVAQVARILVSRRLNLAFNALFLATRFKHEGAAGINCFSPEWDALAKKLLKNGVKAFDLDYENFDGSTAPDMLFLHPRIANGVYNDSDEYQNMRLALTHELCFRYEVVGDCVYQTFGGNPSGDDNTTIRNSLVGAFYLYMTWIYLAPAHLKSYAAYERNVSAGIVGDDNIVTVSESASEFYQPDLICQILGDFKLVATSASDATGSASKIKGQNFFKNLNQCVFLKCKFSQCQDVDLVRCIPQMDTNTINELTNWISVGLGPEEASLENCNTALRMKFFYGRAAFDEFSVKIRNAWKSNCLSTCKLHSFDELLHEWRSGQFQAFPQTSPANDAPIVLE